MVAAITTPFKPDMPPCGFGKVAHHLRGNGLAAGVLKHGLGAPDYPWFAKSRVFVADRFGEWAPVMSAIHDALQDRFS